MWPIVSPILLPILRPIAAAFGFLTRLPVPGRAGAGATMGEADLADDLGRSVVWFPLVGAALGGVSIALERLARGHLSPGLVAVALVAAAAALTGGLHLDGLADTFDAWGGGRGDRTRMLEIMRDSRIGAHGAVALFLVLAAKLFAMVDLVGRGVVWPLFAAPLLARWAVVPLMVFFRYARPAGLGAAFRAPGGITRFAGASVVMGLGLALGAAGMGLSIANLSTCATFGAGAAAALGVALGLAARLDRRLGGLTGDVYGAAIELAELAVLVAGAVTASR
jgi:adenosylcobinamide-GDP ribazoletransferase